MAQQLLKRKEFFLQEEQGGFMEGPDHDPGIGGRDYGALILRHGAAFLETDFTFKYLARRIQLLGRSETLGKIDAAVGQKPPFRKYGAVEIDPAENMRRPTARQ